MKITFEECRIQLSSSKRAGKGFLKFDAPTTAWKHGDIAVHLSIDRADEGRWTISHIPTGARFGSLVYSTRKKAETAAAQFVAVCPPNCKAPNKVIEACKATYFTLKAEVSK